MGNLIPPLLSGGGKQLARFLIPILTKEAVARGAGAFLNQFSVSAPPLKDEQGGNISVEDANVLDLIANITIGDINLIDSSNRQYLIDSLNRFADDPTEKNLARISFQNRDAYEQYPDASDEIKAQDNFQREAQGQVNKTNQPTEGLDLAAAKIVKQKNRASTDRHYVSRQPWEFDYCMKPLSAFHNGQTTIEAVGEAGDKIINPSQFPTLGAFIDAKLFRETIELWRSLVGVTKGRNMKRAMELTGSSREAFLASLIADPDTKIKFIEGTNDVPFLVPD